MLCNIYFSSITANLKVKILTRFEWNTIQFLILNETPTVYGNFYIKKIIRTFLLYPVNHYLKFCARVR